MITWTPAAHEELRRQLDLVRRRLTGGGNGVDANEVVDDLRRHVDEEFASSRLNVVTVEEVRRVMSRIGVDAPAEESPPPAAEPQSPYTNHRVNSRVYERKPTSGLGTVGIVLFGIVTPLIAIICEAAGGLCAQELFNPFPTGWHVALALFVPMSNLWLLSSRQEFIARHRRAFNWLNSFAIGVGLFYTAIFLPLLPVGIVGIAYLGLGFLPLSPLTGLIANLSCRRRYLTSLAPDAKGRLLRIRGGIVLAVLAVLALHAPPALTHMGLRWAVSDSADVRGSGLWLLRHIGNEEIMLRACYAQSGRFGDPLTQVLSLGAEVTPEQAREAFYRASGTPFDALPPPKGSFAWGRGGGEWDYGQGGDAVAGQLKGLSLSESRFDGLVDGDGVWAYGEWTMVFRNDWPAQREARAQILLPPGGVVSRLTLWVNGQPCEAAFSGREHVKQAYKSVVTVQRRDPVLVTTAGPDRVMMQCFPVPANGGTMKIRMGITYPLQLARADQANFGLPAIIERNFAVKESLKHSIWMESSTPLADASGLLRAEHPNAKVWGLRGEMSDAQISGAPATLTAARDANVRTSWAIGPLQVKEANGVVVQQIAAAPVKAPSRVVMVIDTSKGMGAVMNDVAEAIKSLPAGTLLSVVLTDDAAIELTGGAVSVNGQSVAAVGEQLRKVSCQGGIDSVPALCAAWDLAAQAPDGLILWMHGTQPVILSGVEALRQRYERRPDGPRLIMVQAAAGPNRVCESLDRQGDISRLGRSGSVGDDLRKLFYSWSSGQPALAVSRGHATTQPTTAGAKQTSPHLARLWAADEVKHVAQSGKSSKIKEAMQLASSYQLVTPLSGAVVLENQAQFAANNLTPVDPATVPTVPEPETVAMIVIAAMVFLWVIYKRRVAWRR